MRAGQGRTGRERGGREGKGRRGAKGEGKEGKENGDRPPTIFGLKVALVVPYYIWQRVKFSKVL